MRTDNFEPNLQYQYSNDPGEPEVPAIAGSYKCVRQRRAPLIAGKGSDRVGKRGHWPTSGRCSRSDDRELHHLVTEQSTRLLAKSRSSLDYSAATERPAPSETATPLVKPDFMSGENTSGRGGAQFPEVKQHSERSRRSTNSRSKKPIKRRGKAPRIRAWKGDPSQKADLVPAEGADEYWEYDEELKAYYHIDSDTGSTFWYEDSSDESEA